MGEVLPLCASPRGLFFRTAAFIYEESRQSMKTMVSSFKKFRWALPDACGGPSLDEDLVRNESWWLLLCYVAWFFVNLAFLRLATDRTFLPVILVVINFMHLLVLYSIVYWHREMPFRLIGAKAKFMMEVIPMITAAALPHLLQHNFSYPAILLGFTTHFYAFAHFMHAAYETGGVDLSLVLVMQVLVYILDVELLGRAVAVSFCFALCFYRYMTYCAPEVPNHPKKEYDRLPC